MRQRVFVYGTLLRGEVNHWLLRGARYLGTHRTQPRFRLYRLGSYPGLTPDGSTAVVGEVYAVDSACLCRLDRLEEYPRLYDRVLIPTPYGRAWIYRYRGNRRDRLVIPSGDWRALVSVADSPHSAGVRGRRDAKNRPGHA